MDAIDGARAAEYALLGKLLAQAPDADFLRRLSRLSGDATPLGRAHAELGAAAARTSGEEVEREFFHLFIGIGRSELLPYGSYYLTGFLNERPLARLREDLGRLGITRSDDNHEPEDHAAILCEIMAGIVRGEFAATSGTDRELFGRHLAPWIGRFFADLERAEAADFYRHVGALGRLFVSIEADAFALPS
jgi:TorA maturation chaperone TorD